jgi:nucleotide-binding universal stress UspA family protein
MSGIIVGIDGSSHSQAALEWAMREAVTRRVPLTVSTAEQVAASGWHGLSRVTAAKAAIRPAALRAGALPG